MTYGHTGNDYRVFLKFDSSLLQKSFAFKKAIITSNKYLEFWDHIGKTFQVRPLHKLSGMLRDKKLNIQL